MTQETQKKQLSLNVGQPTKESIELFDTATTVWGTDAQISVCIGELGELLTLVGRNAQGRATIDDWRSEIADVIICAWQLSRIYGISTDEQNDMICHKLNRFKHKLDTMESIKPGNRTLFDRAYEEANARIEKFHETVNKQ